MLQKLFNKILIHCSSKYRNYTPIIFRNKVNNFFTQKKNNSYLFILSPPFCGSTLLSEIISASNSVSSNNVFGTREGQQLPTLKNYMFTDKRWDSNYEYNWDFIKKEWLKYWDLRKEILLEKSPASIVRAKSIENNFSLSNFIIFYRNPYAHCESLIRRINTDPASAASFAITCLQYQKNNIENLKNHVQISYESLTTDTDNVLKILSDFLPSLDDITINEEFEAHNYLNKKMKITNLNDYKINQLTKKQLTVINPIFIKNIELLDFFNYSIMDNN